MVTPHASLTKTLVFVIGALCLPSSPTTAQGTIQAVAPKSQVATDQWSHRGFVINLALLQSRTDRAALIEALGRQLDMILDAGFDKSTQEFFRSVPMIVDPAAVAEPNYAGSPARYAKKNPNHPGTDEPGSITIVPKVYDSNAPIFLHEFLHAYHDQRLPQGFENPELLQLYSEASKNHAFPADSYMMSNVKDYFAMAGSVYLHGSANRDPFTRDKLKTQQPTLYDWLAKQFGPR
jgi:hypothetical protein